MNDQPSLALRQARLVALAEEQRRTLAGQVEVFRRPLAMADRGIAAARFVKAHPVWILGGALAPAALRPSRIGTWLRRGFVAWQVVRRLAARNQQSESPARNQG